MTYRKSLVPVIAWPITVLIIFPLACFSVKYTIENVDNYILIAMSAFATFTAGFFSVLGIFHFTDKILIRITKAASDEKLFNDWMKLRNESEDEDGKLCYCGHTHKCECCDPSIEEFQQSVKNGSIRIGHKNNGWKKCNSHEK